MWHPAWSISAWKWPGDEGSGDNDDGGDDGDVGGVLWSECLCLLEARMLRP